MAGVVSGRPQAPQKIFRQDAGYAATDTEYQQWQTAQENKRQVAAAASGANRAQQPVMQQTRGYSPDSSALANISMGGTGRADRSEWSGDADTPPMSPRDEMMMHAEFATRDKQEDRDILAEQERAQRAADEATFNSRFAQITSMPTPGAAVGGSAAPAFDEGAARAAAFARQKDTVAANSRASVDALSNVLGERGLKGGGYEGAGVTSILEQGQGEMGDAAREQTIQDVNRSADVADRDYQGAIQQRGQDLGYRESLLSLLRATGGLY